MSGVPEPLTTGWVHPQIRPHRPPLPH